MKYIGLLSCMVMLGVFSTKAQQVDSTQTEFVQSETAVLSNQEMKGLYASSALTIATEGCSLIQDPNRSEQIYQLKNGYAIIADNGNEVVEVEQKKNEKILKYYTPFEALLYNLNEDGKFHYKYYFDDGSNKVTVKLNKNGSIYIDNKSNLTTNEVLTNVERAIRKGAETCASTAFSN